MNHDKTSQNTITNTYRFYEFGSFYITSSLILTDREQ